MNMEGRRMEKYGVIGLSTDEMMDVSGGFLAIDSFAYILGIVTWVLCTDFRSQVEAFSSGFALLQD